MYQLPPSKWFPGLLKFFKQCIQRWQGTKVLPLEVSSFRRLETRRVLSVTGAFAPGTGVLDIGIVNDGSNVAANLLDAGGGNFFVDFDNDLAFDPGETTGAIANLEQINVLGDTGVGAFFWSGDFSAAPLSTGPTVVSVVDVQAATLQATATINGDATIITTSAMAPDPIVPNLIRFGGDLTVTGDLSATTTTAGSLIDNQINANLDVAGNALFNGETITLGTQAGDQINFGTLTAQGLGVVTLNLEGSTQLVGSSSSTNFSLVAQNDVNLDAAASINATGAIGIAAGDDINLDGDINAAGSTVDLSAADQIVLSGTASITNTIGNINLTANGTGIDMQPGSFLTASNGSITLLSNTLATATITTRVVTAGSNIAFLSADDLVVDGLVTSINGSIDLTAGDDLFVNSSVTAASTGTLHLQANNFNLADVVGPNVDGININATVSTNTGDLLLESQQDIRSLGLIASTSGDIGLAAVRNIIQVGNIATSTTLATAGVAINAGQNFTMQGSSISAFNVAVAAGGAIDLGLIVSTRAGLRAVGNINDNNGGNVTNIRSQSATLRANRIGNADPLNPTTSANDNAIDLEVGTVAASATTGIYLQQVAAGTSLAVDHVNATNVSVTANQIPPGGMITQVTQTVTVAALDDLTGGPVKVAVRNGNLTINDGTDGDNLGVVSSGDVALTASNNIVINAGVQSAGGNITAQATNNLTTSGAITTSVAGTLVLDGFDVTLGGTVTTANGDILIRATRDLSTNANITSTNGDIGLYSVRDVLQSSNITTNSDILVNASRDYTMTGATNNSANMVGNATRNIRLGLIIADQVGLIAGQNILDNNGGSVTNIRAASVSLQATGSIGQADLLNPTLTQNANAIDTEVGTIAAVSGAGIYVQQVAAGGNLLVDNVAGFAVAINTTQANFNSTSASVDRGFIVAPLDDLTGGPIKVVVLGGDLLINDGNDADNIGVQATVAGQDILLSASGDVVIASTVIANGGHITLRAGDDLFVNQAVTTNGAGSIFLRAENLVAGDTIGPQVDGINVNATVTTTGGGILVQSLADIRIPGSVVSTTGGLSFDAAGNLTLFAPITNSGNIFVSVGQDLSLPFNLVSTNGNVGVVAGRDVLQTNLFAANAGSVFVSAGRDYVMNQSVTALNDVLVSAGRDIQLAAIQANRVGIVATQNVIDNNGANVANVISNQLQIVAAAIGAADPFNGLPTQNANAIDIQVNTVATQSTNGTYLQQLAAGGDLIVGNVGAFNVSASANVSAVDFRSTTSSPVTADSLAQAALSDLTGNIVKLAVRNGTLTINDGADADSLGVSAVSDIVLLATNNIVSTTGVTSTNGHVTAQATNNVTLGGVTSTGLNGTVLLDGTNVNVNGTVSSAAGDILIRATQDVVTTATIASTSGDIGLFANRDVLQNANVSTSAGVLVSAGRNYTMSSATTSGAAVVATAVNNISLDLVTAPQIALNAGQNILDNNGANVTNLRGTSASLRAGVSIGLADAANGTPTLNANAIDTELGTVAASSTAGIYIQEVVAGGSLIVGNVAATNVSVGVQQANFNSTTTPVNLAQGQATLDDLTGGPVKLVVRSGNLTITDGLDGDSLGVSSSSNALLSASGDILVGSGVSSNGGHITIQSVGNLSITAAVQTNATGSILLDGFDINVNAAVANVNGEILARATQDLRNTVAIASTSGDIGLVASRDVLQNANVSTAAGILVDAGRNFTMNAATANGSTVVAQAVNNIALDLIVANQIALNAGQNILDNNGANVTNLRGTSASLRAGGSIGQADVLNGATTQNANAIDTELGTIAANSVAGIYLQEVIAGGSLIVDRVAAATVNVNVTQVNFNSTTTAINRNVSQAALDDLTGGPVKVAVRNGNLIINDGLDGDNVGVVSSGDIVLFASGDVITNTGISSTGGNLSIQTSSDINVASSLSTGGSGTILLDGANINVNATVSSASGDILLLASGNISTTANISSTTGDIGLIATGSVLQSSNVTTAAGVLVSAGQNYTMSGATTSGATVVAQAGNNIALDLIAANLIALNAGQNILDNNGANVTNLRGTSASLRAGNAIGQSDALNLTPTVNANAIDTELGTVAASSTNGIYLQEVAAGGSLIVDRVAAASVNVNTSQANFNSTTTPTNRSLTLAALDDLSSGPVKVTVRGGNLTINDGADGDILGVLSTSDVLLNATGNVQINTGVQSSGGNVTAQAGTNLTIGGAVSTNANGTILLEGNDVAINATVTSVNGDILARATQDLRNSAIISSTTGNIGLVATRDVLQNANVSTNSGILISAGRNFTMSGATSSGNVVVAQAGTNISLDLITASQIALSAGQNILDNNGANVTNLRGSSASLRAGGSIGLADTLNGTPTLNANAIDTELTTVAASSTAGIYLQEVTAGGSLIVGNVAAVGVSVNVLQANFNSTTTGVNALQTRATLDDLTGGPVKLVVRNGDLLISDGFDGDNLGVASSSNILLAASGDVLINSGVSSNGGHINVQAGGNVTINTATQTNASGSVLLDGTDINVNAAVTSVNGDILARATQDLRNAATITSTAGNIGLVANRDVLQSANVSTNAGILVDAGRNYTMSGATSSGATVVAQAGDNIALDLIIANEIALNAGQNILDNNGANVTNLRGTSASLRAGGSIGQADTLNGSPTLNANAIDTELGTVAANSTAGIYLQEVIVGGNLVVDRVAAATVNVNVSQVNFNSTTSAVNRNLSQAALDDLTGGPVKVVVQAGRLTINDGADGDNLGIVSSSDVLLNASGNVIANTGIAATNGNVSVQSGIDVFVNGIVSTTGFGTVLIDGTNVNVNAAVTSAAGDILIRATQDVVTTAAITSTSGDIGLLAIRDVLQNANVTTTAGILVNAGRNYAMNGATSNAATVVATAGNDISLGLIAASQIALTAGQNILDNNGASVTNLRGTSASLRAGGSIGQADTLNGTPAQNANAIDTELVTVAANSSAGIYLQEVVAGGSLIVSNVAAAAVSVDVLQANFNSTTTALNAFQAQATLDDLTSGPVKVVVLSGDLTINDGLDGDNVGVQSSGDVLLAASRNVLINSGIQSTGGNVTAQAGTNLTIGGNISTNGSGTILLEGTDVNINAVVSNFDGDILARATRDLRNSAVISSNTGDIGLLAARDVLQSANVNTNAGVLVNAGRNFTMSGATTSAGTVVAQAINNISLDLIAANRIALSAGLNILDNNGANVTNLRGDAASLRAGGSIGRADAANGTPAFNANAIDIELGTVAAAGATGTYLQEVAAGGSLVVGNVAATGVSVNVSQANFNSTTTAVNFGQAQASLDDLTDTIVKLVVQGGDLIINDGFDGDNLGVSAGSDALLAASGNVLINSGVASNGGHVSLQAGSNLTIAGAVQTTGTGSILFDGTDIDINATVTSVNGDILARATQDLRNTATITSTIGDIGLVAARDVLQSADVSNNAGILVNAGRDYTMSGATSSGATVVAQAGNNIALDLIVANQIVLNAGQNILDNNGASVTNLRAPSASLRAGGSIGQADTSNGTATLNANAIDTELGTVAANSTAGTYLQEVNDGGNLIVGNVAAALVSVDVSQVNFNSTTTSVNAALAQATLDDLNGGPVKVIVQNGNLTINDGLDGDSLGVVSSENVLMAASGNVLVNSGISSNGGHITVQAGGNVTIAAAIQTNAIGSVLIEGTDINVNGTITSVDGDILARATQDLRNTATITSTTGDIGLVAVRDVLQSANVSTNVGILVDAGRDFTMSGATASAATVIARAGNNIALDLIAAPRIALNAGQNILDNNGADVTNLRGTSASLRAGGSIGQADTANPVLSQNRNAIDIDLDTVAAVSNAGIYLQEVVGGGNLIVGNVAAESVNVIVSQVNFNSTTSLVNADQTQATLDDLTGGPVKIVVRDGDLFVNDGLDGNGLGVSSTQNVLLSASGTIELNAAVVAGAHITFQTGLDLNIGSTIATSGSGTILFSGRDINVNAAVTTVNGDILMRSTRDFGINASISSTRGDIGLVSGRDVLQQANVATATGIFVEAIGNYVMTNATTSGSTVVAQAGNDIRLGLVDARFIALNAGRDILDNNGADFVNLRGNSASLRAGGSIGQADTTNALLTRNSNAIDTELGTLAASSTAGIYIQEISTGGSLIVDRVAAASVNVNVIQVDFRSTGTLVSESRTQTALDDLTGGPVKVVVQAGQLTIDDGGDNDRIGVASSSDVLLSASTNVLINTGVTSSGGNVTVQAGGTLTSAGPVSTNASGTIYFEAQQVNVDAAVTSVNGDILVRAAQDISTTALIASTTGDIGLVAARDIMQSGNVTTNARILIDVGRNFTMATATTSGAAIVVNAGTDVALDLIVANQIAISAGRNIIDNNGADTTNLRGNAISLRAGGSIGSNQVGGSPIDLEATTIAANGRSGVYIHEVAAGNNLEVAHVNAVGVAIGVQQVDFRSTTNPQTQSLVIDALDDLTAANPIAGSTSSIEVTVANGTLTVRDGTDGDNIGIAGVNGSVLVDVTGGNILLDTRIVTAGVGALGTVQLNSSGHIEEISASARIEADILRLRAGTFVHLHDTNVNQLFASVGNNGTLQNFQVVNAVANARGDDFLASLPQTPEDLARFNFSNRYNSEYALYLVNAKQLIVSEVVANGTIELDNMGQAKQTAPNVYIETKNFGNSIVDGMIATKSATVAEGGIILVAGGNLTVPGLLMTSSVIQGGTKEQLITEIGTSLATAPNSTSPINYVNASAFDSGQGLTDRDPIFTTTEFVIRDQVNNLSALSEDYRTRVLQKVVLQFGVATERGFETFIRYADDKLQKFDTVGEIGEVGTPPRAINQNSFPATPSPTSATVFEREDAFDSRFLDATQTLNTTVLIRRADDFFLFSNASAASIDAINDLTFQTFAISVVSALGTGGATELPLDLPSVTPPPIVQAVSEFIVTQPTNLPPYELDLTVSSERNVEVAIYRVFYDDADQDGYADDIELPSSTKILDAESIDQVESSEKSADDLKQGKRLKIETLSTESGASPTPEEIDELKNRFLKDPQQSSGAYAIVEKSVDDKESVLDVFSVRDDNANEDADDLLIIRPKTPEEKATNNSEDAKLPAEQSKPADEDTGFLYFDAQQKHQLQASSRFAAPGAVAVALTYLAVRKDHPSTEAEAVFGNEHVRVGLSAVSRRMRQAFKRSKKDSIST